MIQPGNAWCRLNIWTIREVNNCWEWGETQAAFGCAGTMTASANNKWHSLSPLPINWGFLWIFTIWDAVCSSPFSTENSSPYVCYSTQVGQEQSEDWSTCVVCDPSSEASRCTTWSTWIPDGKTNKKHLQVKYHGVHSSVRTKQLGAPHGTENGSFHFGSLCLLQTLVLCQVGLESSATFTTQPFCAQHIIWQMNGPPSSLLVLSWANQSFAPLRCFSLKPSKIPQNTGAIPHQQVWFPSKHASTRELLTTWEMEKTKTHDLWIKWVNWSILRLTLSIDSFHFSLYKSFVTPLSFPTYLTAQQEAYHIQPPEVLPRTLVLVPCEKASHGFFHSSSGYNVYIPIYTYIILYIKLTLYTIFGI